MRNAEHIGGLYDRQFEHDACGLGTVVHLDGVASHAVVDQALTVLERLDHRGATGSDPETGDGAGILIQIDVSARKHHRRTGHRFTAATRAAAAG